MDLDEELSVLPFKSVDDLGGGFSGYSYGGCCFVDEVDCGVGETTGSEVSGCESCCSDDSTVGDGDTVVDFVALFETSEDGNGFWDGGLGG